MTMTAQKFLAQRIPSPLKEAFEEMMSSPTGRRLADSCAQRGTRFVVDPSGKLGRSSMTINLLRLVIIGREALQHRPTLINSLAHEASHIEQRHVSDSFEQEYRAFVTAAQVMRELNLQDPSGWDAPELQNLSPEQAARKIMEMFPDHPLYGMNSTIPVYQVRGPRGFIELIKQAWALLKAA